MAPFVLGGGDEVIYQPTHEFINHFLWFINQLSDLSTTLGNINAIRPFSTKVLPQLMAWAFVLSPQPTTVNITASPLNTPCTIIPGTIDPVFS